MVRFQEEKLMGEKTTVLKSTMIVLALVLIAGACAPAPTATPVPTKPPAATQPPAVGSTVAATKPAATVPPTTAPTAVPPTNTPAKPIDIELWAQATSTQAPAPPDDWIGFKTIREKLNINLKYVVLPTGADGEQKLNAAAAANALPDLFQNVSTTTERNKALELYKQGLIAPVDKLLPLMPTRVKLHYNDPATQALVTFDGVQYAFVEAPNLPKREGLVIRKDWLDKLGLKAPTTVDELFAVAKAFTEKDPDGNGKNDTYGLGGYWDSATWGIGNRFDFVTGAYGLAGLWNFANPDKFALNVRDPDYIKALAAFRQFNEAKVIEPDWATISRDQFRINWPQGRYGIMWEDFCALACVANYPKFDKNFPNGEWMPLPALKGPTGKSYLNAYGSIGSVFAISKRAADAGKGPVIAKLLEWMAQPEGYYLLGFGVEGVNYKLKEGVVTTEGIPAAQAWNAEGTARFTQMRNQLIFYNDPNEVEARYPSFKTTTTGKLMQPMAFYKFFSTQPWIDSKPQQLVVFPSNRADLKRFYDENILGFALGTKPLNDQTWSDFLKGLDNLGANKWEADTKKLLQDAGVLKK